MEKTVKTEICYRSSLITRDAVDKKAREVALSFSSEAPVRRYHWDIGEYDEVLSHDPNDVDLSFISAGRAPLLANHDRSDQIGVISKAIIDGDGRVGRAVAKFGNGERAESIFQDVVDEIRSNVSVGYQQREMMLIGRDEETDIPTYSVKWKPLEVSIVSIPADETVGVGRDDQGKFKTTVYTREVLNMSSTLSKRESDILEIIALGEAHGYETEARDAIENGKGLEQFRTEVLDRLKERGMRPVIPADTAQIGLTAREINEFSFVRAINALANPLNRKAQEAAGFEFEASRAAQKRTNRDSRGIMVPADVVSRDSQRDLLVGTDNVGGYTVATNLVGFIEMLRNQMVVGNAGATMLTSLVGDVGIPSHTAGCTAYWVEENGAVTESSETFGQIALAPKTVGAMVDISRKLIIQSSIDIENFVRKEIAESIAIEVDRVALHGSGSGNQPTGLASTAGIGSVAGGTNGLAPAQSHIVELETDVSVANAANGNLAYITNAKVRGKCKQIFSNPTYGEVPLWTKGSRDGVGELNGYPAYATNQVSSTLTKGSSSGVCSAIFFGNWADLIVAMWGGIDLLTDPYTGSAAGTVRVVAHADVDIGVRHAASFSAMLDALTA